MTEVNKVIYGSDVLIDLTSDTVTSELLAAGETAHDASGKKIVGSATFKSGIPDGGTIGQVLAKISDTDGDAGWFDIHKLPNNKWYLPEGILEDQVIAAYQFVGRGSEAEALININEGTEYALSKSSDTILWNSETGIFIPATSGVGLKNSTLTDMYEGLYSAVFGFHSLALDTSKIAGGIAWHSYRTMWLKGISNGTTFRNAFCINSSLTTANIAWSETLHNNGVLGGNFPRELFYNGTKVSISSAGGKSGSTTAYGNVIGQVTDSSARNSFYVTAAVFYNTVLSTSQHLDLSDNIRALGGIS